MNKINVKSNVKFTNLIEEEKVSIISYLYNLKN